MQFRYELLRLFSRELRDHRLRGCALRGDQVQSPLLLEIAADSRVGIADERFEDLRMPVVAPGKAVVHALLHDGPGTGVRKKEIVMIELKAVLDRVVVDLCR